MADGNGESHRTEAIGAGLAVGIAIGVALSVATGNWAMLAIGVAIGAAIGTARIAGSPDEGSDDENAAET